METSVLSSRSVIFLNIDMEVLASLFPYWVDLITKVTTVAPLCHRLVTDLLDSGTLATGSTMMFALVDDHTEDGEQYAEDEDQE